jgi:outer membrane protein OmpA-like peptidoglycan-associated protein
LATTRNGLAAEGSKNKETVMRHENKTGGAILVLALLVSVAQFGCATKKYTRTQVSDAETRVTDRVDQQVDDLQGQIETNQTEIKGNKAAISRNEKAVGEASKTAKEALDRAVEAGKLAEGKLLFETVLSNDDVRFGFEKSGLSDEAKAALDAFADSLKNENKNIYIEIQGHTDSSGPEEYNFKLGEERAIAVQRYLSKVGIPLHRMSAISYGEAEPVTTNDTRENRARNRRVVLVVLQ